MATKAMVAVCDLLGFSALVKTSTFEELVNIHVPSFLNVQKGIRKKGTFPPATHEEIFRDGFVGHAFFSDTVLLYSLSEDRYGYENIIDGAMFLVAYSILWPPYRFRLGISYGEFYADAPNNVYAGKALVEAHELERNQDWCGGALTRTAEERIREVGASQYSLVQYAVPFRSSNTESLLAINWTLGKHDPIAKEFCWLERSYTIPQTEEEKAAERKLKNTEQFHLDKCVQCREYRKHLPKAQRCLT